MGLVISLRTGEDFFIADERYVLSAIAGTTVRLERPRDGAAFEITNDEMREIEPEVLVQTGDRIKLDVAGRKLELLVSDAELEKRRKAWKAPPVPEEAERGYAKLYRDHVQQADEGCDFDFLAAVKGRN